MKNCTNCGTAYEPTNNRQKLCKKDCGRSSQQAHQARLTRRQINDRLFIGIDGEGVTRPTGEHIYDMLGIGDRSLVSTDGGQLDFLTIAGFLVDEYVANPDAIFIGFFLGYDFNQWFRTLPEERAKMLLTPWGKNKRKRKDGKGYLGPWPVEYGGFQFDILGMKRFKIRRKGMKGWMFINDVGSYFQTSFMAAIDPKEWPDEPVVTPDEYEIIKQGKADRGRLQTLDEQMATRTATAQYNGLENTVLARMMSQFNTGLSAIDIRLKKNQWYGPGQAAQAWLDLIGAPTAELVNLAAPEEVLAAAQSTYFGGWFEIFAHGLIPGDSYEYDINSAYPWIMSGLPCLLHGEWTEGSGKEDFDTQSPWTLVEAEIAGSNPIVGTMLHRTDKQTICRPHHTAGWYWWHELNTAMKAGFVDTIKIKRWYRYEPCDCPSPFGDAMPTIYKERLKVGKNSPQGKAYKVVYNSAYGKQAQSIGQPKFSNAIYASLITAGCRTMILEAIGTHPHGARDLLMVATDGVYFRTRHNKLPLSEGTLGMWEEKIKKNLTLFRPGVYWDDETRRTITAGKAPKLKSRGISAGDLAKVITQLDNKFIKGFVTVSDDPEEGDHIVWPSLNIDMDFSMITCTQALARGKWDLAGTLEWNRDDNDNISPYTKKIASVPFGKRDVESGLFLDNGGKGRNLPRIWRSYVLEGFYDRKNEKWFASAPYDKSFAVDEMDLENVLGLTPDGILNIGWILRNDSQE